ncbi:MAG: DUF1629 domain-containing protein [Sphingomonas bacterium]
MAWEPEMEFPNEDVSNPYNPMQMFEEDVVRFRETEAQVVREVKARFEAEGAGNVRSPWWNPHSAIASLGSGWPWPVNEKPFRYRLEERVEWWPDIGNGMSERVVDLIESIEPGVHRYLPIEVYNADGAFRERRWHLNICNRLDTLAPKHSNIVVSKTGSYLIGNGAFQVSAWKHKIAGHAVWVEYLMGAGYCLISDEFYEAIRRHDLHGWDFRRHIAEIG